jgi:hypothetical protein
MTPFCNVEDYRARYPNDTTDDAVLLECLMEATDTVMGELDGHDIDYSDPSESFSFRLMRVTRTVAHRALGSVNDTDVPFGATQISEGSGDFTASVQLGNPYGDMFLTQAEKDALGIGRMRACVLSPYGQDVPRDMDGG